MVTDEFEDLFGSDEPPAPPPRRRRQPQPAGLADHLSIKAASSGRGLQDVGGVQALRRPVTINTLATVFEMDPQTITRRLIDCAHIVGSGGRKLYDFKDACSYIIKPRMTPEQFIKTLNAAKLPPEINKAFWDGQRSRVKYKIESQEAWETEDVLQVLGEVFMTIKDSFTTITEEMRERAKLTDDQAKMFEAAIDEMRAALREKLVELPKQRQTTSVFEKPLWGIGGQTASELPDYPEDDEE